MGKVDLIMKEHYKYMIINKLEQYIANDTKKEKQELQRELVLSEEAHPKQPRCQYFYIYKSNK